MDKQLEKAIVNFYSDVRGIGTEELYQEYLNACAVDDVKPRSKCVIIREACDAANCVIEKKQKVIAEKFFVPKDEKRRDEWRQYFAKRKKDQI